jgi:hypothetical protein
MGREESRFHAEPTGFHGEEFAGKRTHGKTGIPREIGAEVEELKLTLLSESEVL